METFFSVGVVLVGIVVAFALAEIRSKWAHGRGAA